MIRSPPVEALTCPGVGGVLSATETSGLKGMLTGIDGKASMAGKKLLPSKKGVTGGMGSNRDRGWKTAGKPAENIVGFDVVEDCLRSL